MSWFGALLASGGLDTTINDFIQRIQNDSGTFESQTCLEDEYDRIRELSLFSSASLVTTPNGYKASKIYSLKPTDGSGDFTFVRAGTSQRSTSTGQLEAITNNIPLIDYENVSCPFIKIQPARTNLCLQSSGFTSATWSKNALTAAADQVAGPDGLVTADRILETVTNTTHNVRQSVTKAAISLQYTFSVDIKPIGRDWATLQLGDGANSIRQWFNVTGGVLGTNTQLGSTFSRVKASITPLFNGFYRCSLTIISSTGTSILLDIWPSTTDGGVSYAGDITKGLYLTNAQLEQAYYYTSRISTTTTTQSRIADSITALQNSNLIGQTEGTIYLKCKSWTDSTKKSLSLSDGTLNNRITIDLSVNNDIQVTVVTGGVQQALLTSVKDFDNESVFSVAVSYQSNKVALFVNGVKATEDLTVTVPACDRISFDEGDGTDNFYGNIKVFSLWKTALTDLQCEQLTTEVDTSITFSSIASDLTDEHYLVGAFTQNPTNKNVCTALISKGLAHAYSADKRFIALRTEDLGATWNAQVVVENPTDPEAVQDCGGGYDSNGRLHAFYCTHTQLTPGQTHKIKYAYSDDDGDTWTINDLTSGIPSDGLLSWRVIGNMIENNGVLLMTYYKFANEGSFGSSRRYILRSTNYGSTWSHIDVEGTTVAYINESTLIALSSTHVLMIARDGWQYMSTDNGLTWTAQGSVSWHVGTTEDPPKLNKFKIDNQTEVIVCYYTEGNELRAIYALPANLIANGVNGWDTDTITTLQNGSRLRYGDIVHYNNSLMGIGCYTSFSPTSGVLKRFNSPTTHLNTLKTQLGL